MMPNTIFSKRKFEFSLPNLPHMGKKLAMPDLAEYMTTSEAADALTFNVKSVQKMVNNKTLEAVRFGRSWMVSRKSVAEYLEKTRGMSKNDPRRKIAEDD